MNEKDMTFEEAYAKLDAAVKKLGSSDTTLEEAMKCYEEGVSYYKKCAAILDEARQKIEVFKKEEKDVES